MSTAGPKGYQVVFSQNISRHGSRSLTSGADSKRALALWVKAQDRGRPDRDRGDGSGPAVRSLANAMKKIGYGELSTLGKQEQRDLGNREGTRVYDYFEKVEDANHSVAIVNSGVSRTDASGDNFAAGLQKKHPSLRIAPDTSNQRLLKFSDTDPAYEDFLDDGEAWQAAYRKAIQAVDIDGESVKGLELLYTPEFVASISEPRAEARSVWDLYRVDQAMSKDTTADLRPFMRRETAAAFAFAEDAEYFYARGPGITGTNDSYKAARVLRNDFVTKADQRLAGGSTAAVYRFSHDQEVAPFAALLGLPDQQPAGQQEPDLQLVRQRLRHCPHRAVGGQHQLDPVAQLRRQGAAAGPAERGADHARHASASRPAGRRATTSGPRPSAVSAGPLAASRTHRLRPAVRPRRPPAPWPPGPPAPWPPGRTGRRTPGRRAP